MECKTCKHWEKTSEHSGDCEHLEKELFIQIDYSYGGHGGYVDYIETEDKFFCAEFTNLGEL